MEFGDIEALTRDLAISRSNKEKEIQQSLGLVPVFHVSKDLILKAAQSRRHNPTKRETTTTTLWKYTVVPVHVLWCTLQHQFLSISMDIAAVRLIITYAWHHGLTTSHFASAEGARGCMAFPPSPEVKATHQAEGTGCSVRPCVKQVRHGMCTDESIGQQHRPTLAHSVSIAGAVMYACDWIFSPGRRFNLICQRWCHALSWLKFYSGTPCARRQAPKNLSIISILLTIQGE